MPLPPEVVVGRDANAGEATDDDDKRAPASASTSARRAARLFAPLEPAEGEDLLTPYAKPATAVVGGSDASPVWREVAAERADIVSTGEAMPKGKDYIAAYLKQAPGYANLITPFSEMPASCSCRIRRTGGTGCLEVPGRRSLGWRISRARCRRTRRGSGRHPRWGFSRAPTRLGGRDAEPGDGFLEAFVGGSVAGGGATAVEARAPD